MQIYNEQGYNIGLKADGTQVHIQCTPSFLFDGCRVLQGSSQKFVKIIELANDIANVQLFNNQLEELVMPPHIKRLNCSNNKLTKLVLNEGITTAICKNNKLTQLEIPNSLFSLYCDPDLFDYNQLDRDKNIFIYYETE